jgi:Glycosyl transferase family 90
MSEVNWPLIRYSPERLEQLRAAASVVQQEPFAALTTQVGLLASGGHFSQARKLLRLLASEYPIDSMHPQLLSRLLMAAIEAHDPALAAAWLAARFQASYRITFDPNTSSAPADVVQFQVQGMEAQFQFSHALFDSPTSHVPLSRWCAIFGLFDVFMKSSSRIDGAVAVNLGDRGSQPGLAFCENRPGYYLIPDAHYMAQQQYNHLREDFCSQPIPWRDRKPIAFWRGSTTGELIDPTIGWRSLPRIRLCEIARDSSGIIDAGITGVADIYGADASDEIRAANLFRTRVKAGIYQQYRYQIDIDGNTNAWDGFFMRLLTGSPVLKVASRQNFEQWYYPRLEPWVNFVPVDADMADLVEKVTWLRANDDVARRIGEAGLRLAETLMQPQELGRAAPVISAAMRAERGAPLIDLQFASGVAENQALLSGWLEAGVRAAGSEARLVLPRPPGFGDYVLMAEVSPPSQHQHCITITVADSLLLRQSIGERATLYCLLPRAIATADETFVVTLRSVTATENGSQAGFNENDPTKLTLHRIGIATRPAWDGYADTATLLADLTTRVPRSVVHDLGLGNPDKPRLVQPPGATRRTVRTCFGTILYADDSVGRVRHGKENEVPRNLFLFHIGNVVVLARPDGLGSYVAVGLRPEGPEAVGDDWTPWSGGGLTQTFTMKHSPDMATGTFGLLGAGLFLCADRNGELLLSRPKCRSWELFSLEPEKT